MLRFSPPVLLLFVWLTVNLAERAMSIGRFDVSRKADFWVGGLCGEGWRHHAPPSRGARLSGTGVHRLSAPPAWVTRPVLVLHAPSRVCLNGERADREVGNGDQCFSVWRSLESEASR
jgi:hypothetical protein